MLVKEADTQGPVNINMLDFFQKYFCDDVVYTGTFTREYLMNDDDTMTSVVTVIRILYYASLLAGAGDKPDWDTAELPMMDADNFSSIEIAGNASRKRYQRS